MNDDDMPDVKTVLDVYDRYDLPAVFTSRAIAQIILRLENDRAMLLAALEGMVEWADTDTLNPEGTLQRRLITARAAIERAKEER